MISYSLYGMFIVVGVSSFTGGFEVGVTGVESVANCFVGVWGTRIGARCADAGCGRIFVFGTGRDDAVVSNIVASFLSAVR